MTIIPVNRQRSLQGPEGNETQVITPPVDAHENNDEYFVVADLPGATSDRLSIELERGVLTIEAHANLDTQPEVDELTTGSTARLTYRRRLRLPTEVDAEGVKAQLEHGVLRLHIPKSDAVRPRRIAVQAA